MLDLHLGKGRDAPYRILCLGAHSDDIEIGCGGTILKLLQSYRDLHVHWVVFSANEERAQEAQAAAHLFLQDASERQIDVHRFKDGFFPFQGAAIKEAFEEIAQAFSPDLIFTHFREDRHQDHRMVSDLTWNTFRNHLILEYEIPKFDGDLGQPNFFVYLDEALCNQKVAYLHQSFSSQVDKHWFTKETFIALLQLRGIESRAPDRYAEAFHCRKLVFA